MNKYDSKGTINTITVQELAGKNTTAPITGAGSRAANVVQEAQAKVEAAFASGQVSPQANNYLNKAQQAASAAQEAESNAYAAAVSYNAYASRTAVEKAQKEANKASRYAQMAINAINHSH